MALGESTSGSVASRSSSESTKRTPGQVSSTASRAVADGSVATTSAPAETRWPMRRPPTLPAPTTAMRRPARSSVPKTTCALAWSPRKTPRAVRMPESPTPPFSGDRPVVHGQTSPMTSMSATVMPTSPAVTYLPSRDDTSRP